MSQTPSTISPAADAQLMLEGTKFRVSSWQLRAQVVDALVRRPQSDRILIVEECVKLQVQILDAKTEIIMAIAEAKGAAIVDPDNWRDFESALDDIVETLRRVERRARLNL